MPAPQSIPPQRSEALKPIAAVLPESEPPLTTGEKAAVDDRQDEIMSLRSTEGNPPSHHARRVGWTIWLIALPVVLIGGLALAIFNGVNLPTILGFAAVIAIALAVGGGPVLAAGLSRGREEATARVDAIEEVHPGAATKETSTDPKPPSLT